MSKNKNNTELIDNRTDVEISNDIALRFKTIEDMVYAASLGLNRSMFCYGPPGVGKSTVIMNALENSQANYELVKGHITEAQLYVLLYTNRHENYILVLDDADSVFAEEKTLNILKAATDSTSTRLISWRSSRDMYTEAGELVPSSFEYNGSIIFITNKDFDAEIAKDNKLSCHFDALRSRSHYISVNINTKRELLVYIANTINSTNILKSFDKTTKRDIIQFIDDNKYKLNELSLRLVKKLSDLVRIFPDTWRDTALVTLTK